jgi:hypothetical protein
MYTSDNFDFGLETPRLVYVKHFLNVERCIADLIFASREKSSITHIRVEKISFIKVARIFFNP